VNYYGAKDMAAAFRTVRKNTLKIAEEIPEDQYNFRAAEGTQTVGEMLTHIALGARFQEQVNFVEKRTNMEGFEFMKFVDGIKAEMNQPRTKAQIVELLRVEGEKFATTVEGLTDEFLGESIMMPPGGATTSRTRFDMLLGVKEHEMHHRAQLMLIQRILGMMPHLAREQQARMAAMRERAAAKQAV
jgi:uncharacterized damage-inducible protein DinB